MQTTPKIWAELGQIWALVCSLVIAFHRAGPAAYGLGGKKPTVTDANLVLGRLEPNDFLGGEMSLDVNASRKVVGELANKLKIDLLEAAEGILTCLLYTSDAADE